MQNETRKEVAEKKLSKLLPRKTSRQLLAVCEVTGIALAIDAPAISGYVLDYKNPLSRYDNFSRMASLPTKELAQLDPCILAGLLLASLQFNSLLSLDREDSQTIASLNLVLQEKVHPSKLIEAFRFYASIPVDSKIALPALSLKEKDPTEACVSSLSSVLSAHLEACRNCLYSTETHPSYLYGEAEKIAATRILAEKKARLAAKSKQSKTIRQNAAIKEAKLLIKELSQNDTVSKKLVHFCSLLFTDGYIKVAEQETKDRAVKALAILPFETAADLRRIISSDIFSASVEIEEGNEEALFLQEKDLEVEEGLEEVEAEKPKRKTLAEILQEKIQRQQQQEKTGEGDYNV